MEATRPPPSSLQPASGSSTVAAAADSTAATSTATKTTDDKQSSQSEDYLMFGAHPSHLFDDIAITIDSLLTEEIASLPLLPRTLTEQELRQHKESSNNPNSDNKPLTGEEKLIAKLRKAYKKNLDLAETYCSRNIFTVQYYSKTKRRKILESYLDEEDGKEKSSQDGAPSTTSSAATDTLPTSTFTQPPPTVKPTNEQFMNIDKEILISRQRIQQEKQKRIQLKRQLVRLKKASETLLGVQEALQNGELKDESKLKESISSALEGHEELKVWNARAEEVIQILDKIKVEREEGKNGKVSAGGKAGVAGREDDERERKRMLEDIGGDSGGTMGTKEQVDTLLKKLRGSPKGN